MVKPNSDFGGMIFPIIYSDFAHILLTAPVVVSYLQIRTSALYPSLSPFNYPKDGEKQGERWAKDSKRKNERCEKWQIK